MDEWVQDLVSALDDSSLKQETDDQADLSTSSMRTDRDNCRKRRMRKRRTTSTNTHFVSSLISNLVVVNQISKSPMSSSSLDEVVKDYVESFTANCSDESDECLNSWKSRLKFAGLRDRIHHKRVFKQARPCHCESDSHTDNVPVIPRRHRKKKLKRMTVDGGNVCLLQDSQGPTSGSCDEGKKRKKPEKLAPHPSGGVVNSEKMCCESTKAKKDLKPMLSCLICYRKSCDKLSIQRNPSNIPAEGKIGDCNEVSSKNDNITPCQCNCHTNLGKDESSIGSISSSNSDTDSANFTHDDIGGEGDDEMTDFYAESDSGSVLGVPHVYGLPWLKRGHGIKNFSREEVLWSYKMNGLDIGNNPYTCDPRFKRFVPGAVYLPGSCRKSFRMNRYRLPGIAPRSIRRARRRAKVKKSKEKSLREQDFTSLNKLSLSARSKRMRLEGFKDTASNQQDCHSQRNFCPKSLPQLFFTKSFKEIREESNMDMLEGDINVADDANSTAR